MYNCLKEANKKTVHNLLNKHNGGKSVLIEMLTSPARRYFTKSEHVPLFQSGVPQPGCQTGKECKQLFPSFSMLGLVGAKPPSTWTPVMGDVLSPSLPTLAIQVLSSFLPLLQLLPSYATVEEQTRSATDSALLLTRQLSEQHLPSPPLPQ